MFRLNYKDMINVISDEKRNQATSAEHTNYLTLSYKMQKHSDFTNNAHS